MNVPSSIGIKISPDIDEEFKHFISYTATVFTLHIVETLEGDCNEKIDEDKTHNKNVGEIKHPSPTASTTKRYEVVISVVLIAGVLDTIKVNLSFLSESSDEFIPSLASHGYDQRHEGASKCLEVFGFVQRFTQHHFGKDSVSNGGKDENHDYNQTSNIDEKWNGMQEGAEYDVQPLCLL